MSEPKIYLGNHKVNGPTYLSKHKYCGWYWGMGYVGNKNCHWHFDAMIKHPEKHEPNWTNVEHHFSATWLTQDQWWVLRDLFISAYAIKEAAEVYRYGGHQTNKADTYRVLSEEMTTRLNKDLETILDNIWTVLHEWKTAAKV